MDIIKSLIAVSLLVSSGIAFAGEFGDHCTTSLANGKLVKTKCDINAVLDGKAYCFGSEEAKSVFMKYPQDTITKASAFYARNAELEREKLTQEQARKLIDSKDCDLSDKDLGYLELDKTDLRHCKMVNTSFFGAYLRGANLSGANMQKAYLNLARLENADLSNADLTDATIFQAIFDKTNFKGANLTNARMIGTLGSVDMSGANVSKGRFGLDIGNQPMGAMMFDAVGGNFANTNFENSDINRSNVKFANFTNANLKNVDFFRADLSRADLSGADITGANFKEAVLDGTIMSKVKGLASIQGYDLSKGQCVDCKVVETAAAPALPENETAAVSEKSAMVSGCPLTRHALKRTSVQ